MSTHDDSHGTALLGPVGDGTDPFVTPTPTVVYLLSPSRLFEVTSYDSRGQEVKENIVAHTVQIAESGSVVFQTMRVSAVPKGFDPAAGENMTHARPIGPTALEYATSDIFPPGVRVREILLPSFTESTYAN